MNIGVRGRAGLIAAGLLASAGLALAQDSGTTVLVVERAAASEFLVDAKDAGLRRALAMVPDRLGELPREIPEFPPEATGIINLLLTAASRPATLAVRYDADNPSGAGFGYGVVATIRTEGKQEAEALQARVNAMLLKAKPRTRPSSKWPTMLDLPSPAGSVSFGPREAAGGDWVWQVVFGNVTTPDFGAGTLPEPVKGVKTVLRGRLDFAGLTPVVDMFEGFAAGNPQAEQTIEGFRESGMIGEGAVKVNFQVGYTDEESRSISVWEGAKRYMEAWHMTEAPLTKGELAAIPADATMAFLAKSDMAAIQDMIDQAVANAPEAEQGFAQFTQATGVDLRDDVLGTLGGAVGLYASDSTGGGSLGSLVAIISFKDRARFMEAHEKLRAVANSAADQAPFGPGYIRVTPWQDGDTELCSLRFPGVPVPIELTWAATQDWLVVGLTPQAAIAAARQASGKGDDGIGSLAAFRAGVPKGHELVSISYFDTARAMKPGFPLASMVCSAVGNAVRSPGDGGRDPGLVMPTFGELAKGVRAQVQVSYWRDDDFVTETRGDRSLLVNGTAAAGVITEIAPLIAIPVFAGIAAEEARQQHHDFDDDDLSMLAAPRAWMAAALPSFLPTPPTPAIAALTARALHTLRLEAAR